MTPVAQMADFPKRIVCLTEETTEALYLMGEGDRVVGVSGYTVRPPEARSKPKVSAFTTASIDKICALEPEIVLGFSDLQANIMNDLVRRGVPVVVFNQRSVAEILQMILMLGGLIGRPDKAESLVKTLRSEVEEVRQKADRLPRRPKVFFEEWMSPIISGIRWVDELIEIAGGDSIFPELRSKSLAKDRIIDPEEVVRRDPQVIIASWCGKRMVAEKIVGRPGWDHISAVKNGRIHEIKSAYILQPGPAALTEGLSQLHRIIAGADQLET
ncbi:MAG TPA: cobalamin-binding protein [Blastocatellia bacterium]